MQASHAPWFKCITVEKGKRVHHWPVARPGKQEEEGGKKEIFIKF